MDNNQAQKQIQDIFQHPFQRENYMYFLRNLLNQILAHRFWRAGALWPMASSPTIT